MSDLKTSDVNARLEVTAEALRKAEERATAGQLALEVMHEIKNPLEALSNLVYLALQEAENPDKVREYMQLAEEQMSHLRQTTEHTLGFTRVAAARRSIDLVGLTEAALRIHQRTIAAKMVHLVKDLPDELVASVHTGEILQAISNLLVNALDALPLEGTICLRLKKHENNVHILISDNGHGIPAEHVEKIFEPFFSTKGERGTGLGLALTRKIVERHHGKISVKSSVRPYRSGSTFRISLPA